MRRPLGFVLAGLALAIMVAGPADARLPGAERPDDAVTGQDHPADVFAFFWHYVPATVTVKQGHTFKFGNYDPYFGIEAHSLDEVVPGCTAPPYTKNDADKGGTCGYPRFSSGLVDHGYVHTVAGVDKLPKGTYQFNCQVHPFMKGTLVVE